MQNPPSPDSISRLMSAFRKGDKTAANKLIELLHPELRRLAAAKMKGERVEHTWQPTVLVNELYLVVAKMKAVGGESGGDDQEKAAFLALAGHLMKRLLIDHARPLYRRVEKVEFIDGKDGVTADPDGLRFVESALERLEAIDPKLRAVVEMRVFEGLTGVEVAEQLNCSPRTVANHWAFAKRWLNKELGTA